VPSPPTGSTSPAITTPIEASKATSFSERQVQNGESNSKVPRIAIIVPAVCLSVLALAALITWKVRRVASHAAEEPNDDMLGAVSWSTCSPRSVQEEAQNHRTGNPGFEDLSTLGSAGACSNRS
jgi:hypothetical protein